MTLIYVLVPYLFRHEKSYLNLTTTVLYSAYILIYALPVERYSLLCLYIRVTWMYWCFFVELAILNSHKLSSEAAGITEVQF